MLTLNLKFDRRDRKPDIRSYACVPPELLKHLYLRINAMDTATGPAADIAKSLSAYTNLKTLTFILEDAQPLGGLKGGWAGDDVFPAEKGGEIDIAGFGARRKPMFTWLKKKSRKLVDEGARNGCDGKGLKLRWKLLEQFGEQIESGWTGVY